MMDHKARAKIWLNSVKQGLDYPIAISASYKQLSGQLPSASASSRHLSEAFPLQDAEETLDRRSEGGEVIQSQGAPPPNSFHAAPMGPNLVTSHRSLIPVKPAAHPIKKAPEVRHGRKTRLCYY
jgi:hypothetical protein